MEQVEKFLKEAETYYLHGYLATAATECVARSDWRKEEYHHCEYGIHRCSDV